MASIPEKSQEGEPVQFELDTNPTDMGPSDFTLTQRPRASAAGATSWRGIVAGGILLDVIIVAAVRHWFPGEKPVAYAFVAAVAMLLTAVMVGASSVFERFPRSRLGIMLIV